MKQTLRIELASDPADAELVSLVSKSDEYLSALYPPESNHAESISVLLENDASLFLGYAGEHLAACGAIKFVDRDSGYAEIKRLFVAEEFRGQGFAIAMMRRLEDHAKDKGTKVIRLEAGPMQPEALSLYRKLGYSDRGPFGEYPDDPLSVFMEKKICE